MARIAIVHVPFYSHIHAAMRLTDVVARQGHELLVVGPETARGHAERCGATFELQEPSMPQVGGLGYYAELAEITEQFSEGMVNLLLAWEAELLIHDSQAPWARVAGDYLGLPRVVAHPMFPIITDYSKSSPFDDRVISTPPEQESVARFSSHWLSIARRWGVEIESLHRIIHSPAETLIAFTTEEIIGHYEVDSSWHCVGPLMPAPPRPEPSEPPLVYVCFGTAYNKRLELFNMVVGALADEEVEVLVSAGKRPEFSSDGLLTAEYLDRLPPNVTVRDFVPAREVLTRASVHITHGGCNSVHETLLAGVPMVCIPQALDQFPLSKRVEMAGAGVISQEEPRAIREAVRLLLEGGKARACALELREHLIHYDGEQRVAAVIDKVLSENAALAA